jgi:alkylation response protein AidB-like acyl-CoA dehydrogenase
MGLLAMKVPVEDGGSGADNVGYVLAMSAVAEACASTAVILASSNLATKILADHATEAQKERWLRPYARGELGPASFALTEPQGGSDAATIRTSARLEGGEWVLTGSKMWITSGAHAGIHLVFARTDPEGGSRGIGCFVVERGAPGLTVGAEEDKMGLRSSGTVALHFEDCRVPKDSLIGARARAMASRSGRSAPAASASPRSASASPRRPWSRASPTRRSAGPSGSGCLTSRTRSSSPRTAGWSSTPRGS